MRYEFVVGHERLDGSIRLDIIGGWRVHSHLWDRNSDLIFKLNCTSTYRCNDSRHIAPGILDGANGSRGPSLIGHDLIGLRMALSFCCFGIAFLAFRPFDGTESIDPSAEEVLVLPSSAPRADVRDARESP